ncbi:hypothetical protein RHSIM_Rhsim01G0247500 [Rhododendron simsii]|uniref:Rhodanese domain-containing protein n=1 Tax=Rhododendron simsii TaxID=118357 RepID=A0A834HK86_RHOSS|nr:hypothetical protein RHSIM_Rhsim01G0247500 [Rhododendron simsii]
MFKRLTGLQGQRLNRVQIESCHEHGACGSSTSLPSKKLQKLGGLLELVEKCNCTIRHTSREGNQVADRLKKKVGVGQEADVSHSDCSSIRPRNPFFVAGVTFIWLVVIPLTEEYFQKYKFISAIDAFRKLRDDPSTQLLDIRNSKTVRSLGSPNLKIVGKAVAQVEFREGDEDGFVKMVLEKFPEPANSIICILDNFDGNSMKVAELLFKNGFKEAYAIRGGVRGKKGWQEIQETLLPPSVHIYPKKKVKKMSEQLEMNGGVNQQTGN